MTAGAIIEPLVVVVLLFGGAYVNRNTTYTLFPKTPHDRWSQQKKNASRNSSPDSIGSSRTEEGLLSDVRWPSSSDQDEKWRKREISLFGWKLEVASPNTRVFKDRLLSRVLLKFPFLVEAWYWALIYWVYQLGRAYSAWTIVEGTVTVARLHAFQVISLEQRLHIFHELDIQAYFLQHPILMLWINRIYSFIHIPGTIFFLVWLFYYTTVRNRLDERQEGKDIGEVDGSPGGPALFEARRRTMAMCNLLAFCVFTAWPCMPPRLLSDPNVEGEVGKKARSFGFLDTVHGADGESSVWTQNRFCNQYAAMPSLHFGYALLISLTIASLPLAPQHSRRMSLRPFGFYICRLPSLRRLICVVIGLCYASTILIAIIATANHFILDAVAGAMVCTLGWMGNEALLNLLVLEDYFLWLVRIDKPRRNVVAIEEGGVPGLGKGVEWKV